MCADCCNGLAKEKKLKIVNCLFICCHMIQAVHDLPFEKCTLQFGLGKYYKDLHHKKFAQKVNGRVECTRSLCFPS